MSHPPATAAVNIQDWGATPAGLPVHLYTLSNGNIRVRVTEYGARIVSIETPDRQGHMSDIVLGYNNLAQYVSDPKDYFGAVVGRYGNRIAQGTFSLAGHVYRVPINNNGNALHGGPEGFSGKIWKARVSGKDRVEFTLLSPDGDMGFPGALTVHVFYTLQDHRLRIDYEASTTKTTVINLTNHSYFNLAGQASGDILRQELRIDADHFTPIDNGLIPNGNLAPVRETPFDFERLTPIGQRINEANEQLEHAGGYDHNYVLKGTTGELQEAAYAVDSVSGRTLTVLTTEPGVQFYSGNFLDGSAKGYTGQPYKKHAGFCLETQHFPDSPNRPDFPTTLLQPGKTMHSTTVFEFGTAGM
jgi:aldose 1-epimerase